MVVIILLAAGGFYLFLKANETDVCTADIRYMCDPKTGAQRMISSSCSGGSDAGNLEKKGWVDCWKLDRGQK